ncbi:glycosyltransferase family 2 protein [Candidatus Dojkabacteria bacterium]|uniref:Glycosyltransferase family 2 protein n=1 Tax=Candidatus Dojkabacteria bacterium TaxID=2099670 RepID=A0A955L7W0_9BACT|nr:glycosyltransferase family 2 protein [Candidatus Dojkabacteria bacterium]
MINKSQLKISVVIPVYNESEVLEQVLDAILNQTLSSSFYEVIAVDNNSTDNSFEILKNYEERYSNFFSFKQYISGSGPTRNTGVNYTQSELILFLDGDMIADSTLLEEHILAHEDHYGSVLGYFTTDWKETDSGFLQFLADSEIQNAFPVKDRGIVNYEHFYTGNISVPKELLTKAGIFDENYNGYGVEDIDLGYRLYLYGDKIKFCKTAHAIHKYSPLFKPYKKKKYLAGKQLRYLVTKFPHLSRIFTFERYAPYSILLLATLFTVLFPIRNFVPLYTKKINSGFYYWTIRWSMYCGFMNW